ncbi:ABC transporter [Hahella sp. KA22]|uniref:GldG family protein n=1 Tax=Hahella sp. KA22 TaxID=1628392 RepID=UPI000FDD0146|nr:Gldg family protein [Hahella sp. KA22]AZZ91065.1 ABC transporter [Hahella sp. KA22]QAY54435.1 ABC transporter [Hahella sp. KA22]
MKRAGFVVIVVIAALALFNLAVQRGMSGFRWDLTENSLYTLSDGARSILGGLSKDIELTVYYSEGASKDLPALRAYARRVQELLEEFEQLSGGKITLKKVDPVPFSEEEDEATAAGLQAIPVGVAGDNVFFGLVGKAGDKEEIIAFFQPNKEQFLEYELSKLIYNLDRAQPPVVGVISSLQINGGFDMYQQSQQPAWIVMQQIEDLFDVRWLPEDFDAIDEDVDVLMIVHPKDLSQQAQLAIDQFVLKGGRALVFVDPNAEQDQPGMPMMAANMPRRSQLDSLLKAWGVSLKENAVLADFKNSMVVGVGQARTPVRHLALLGLAEDSMTESDIMLAGLESINVSTPGILEKVEGASTSFKPLLTSSDESAPIEESAFANLQNPESLFEKFKATGEQYAMAARVEGPAKTAFPDGIDVTEEVKDEAAQDDPTKNGAEGEEAAPAEPKTVTRHVAPGVTQSDNINVVVIADTDILTDRLWVQVQEFFGQRIASPWANNGDLVVNALDYLAGNPSLINIRSRGRFTRPFEKVDELRRTAEEKFADQQRELQDRLSETEEQLAELQQARQGGDEAGGGVLLTPEQEKALQDFQQEKLRIRKALRDVQHNLDRDIDDLGRQLKLVNILMAPLALTVLALIVMLWRRRGVKKSV